MREPRKHWRRKQGGAVCGRDRGLNYCLLSFARHRAGVTCETCLRCLAAAGKPERKRNIKRGRDLAEAYTGLR